MDAKSFDLDVIYNEDCLEGMKRIPDRSVEATITDIPYGVVNRKSSGLRRLHKSNADIETFSVPGFLAEIVRVTRGSVYVFCATEQISGIRAKLVEFGLTTRLGIWEKTNPSPMNGTALWLSGLECCAFGRKPNAIFHEHCKSPIWRMASVKSKIHPTQKPIKLFERLIQASTNPGDSVLDPCMGSGTTAIACLNTGRHYIGFEKDPEYFRIAQQRISKVAPPLFQMQA